MGGQELRRYPRSHEHVRVRLSRQVGGTEFGATLETADVSFGGAFFTSEFFLRTGMELDVQFRLHHDDRLIKVRGIIVREVRSDDPGSRSTFSGFAVRFIDYYDDAKSILATYFLNFDLEDFLNEYMETKNRKVKSERERVRDALIAWEVHCMELSDGEKHFLQAHRQEAGHGRPTPRTLEAPKRPAPSPRAEAPTRAATKPSPPARKAAAKSRKAPAAKGPTKSKSKTKAKTKKTSVKAKAPSKARTVRKAASAPKKTAAKKKAQTRPTAKSKAKTSKSKTKKRKRK